MVEGMLQRRGARVEMKFMFPITVALIQAGSWGRLALPDSLG